MVSHTTRCGPKKIFFNKLNILLILLVLRLEKEMATHSSVLAWRIPGTGKPGGLLLWGHTESDTTEAT